MENRHSGCQKFVIESINRLGNGCNAPKVNQTNLRLKSEDLETNMLQLFYYFSFFENYEYLIAE